MAGPSKRLGKGSQRLKFKDVSPKAEKEEQEMLDKKSYGGKAKKKMGGGKMKKPVAMKAGGALKDAPADNAGLKKLPQAVRNNMGYKAYGGKMKKMKLGGKCRGMGAATRGGNYSMG